jgi:hypothetical protein
MVTRRSVAETLAAELEYYAAPGEMTALGGLGAGTPETVPELCAMVQGLILHPFWTERYGVADSPDRVTELQLERESELQLRPAAAILRKALELDPAPLTEARPPQWRVLGNCRDFSTVTTALLRSHGVPARARCGFGTYFASNLYIDHWIVEWWDGNRWVRTDPQLDALQCSFIKPDFDVLDVPHDRFIDGGDAWQLYRNGEARADQFGVLDMFGVHFVRGNLTRDLASLNKVELLAWEAWDAEATLDESTLDDIAKIVVSDDFERVRELYETDERVRVPDEVTSFFPDEHRVRVR